MSTYEELLNKFKDYVKRKGRVSLDDMRKWAEENEVGLITLSVIVNDLITNEELRPIGEFKELDEEELALPLPEEVVPSESKEEVLILKPKEEKKKAKREGILRTKKEKRVMKTKLSKISPLFKWSEEEEVEIETEIKKEEKKEKPSVEERREKEEEKVIKIKEEPISKVEEYDEDLKKAIIYLNKYHSVGEIRFLIDLESLGVKNPREVMYRLAELGFIIRKPIGVIDATEKLPKVKIKDEEESIELTRFI
ncbi:MAG: hypothetical protein J7J99_01020 [Thermoprotei archaeon]|nr:hypothetical protein [Thermoprotei archaeon]